MTPDETEQRLRHAVASDPENADAALQLGLYLFNIDREKEASPFLEKAAAAMNPSDRAFLNLLVRQVETREKVNALWKAATLGRTTAAEETALLHSKPCRQADLARPDFQHWTRVMKETPRMTRKLWEWCYTAQALHERGVLRPDKRGLGFAVGREPLVSLFAGLGCSIVATDQGAERAEAGSWIQTKQHSHDLSQLNLRSLCPADDFIARVSFREVDMNRIPEDLKDFDFLWSCCAFEHTGTLESGMRFVEKSMECLKPGGIAVHTTEFNVLSDDQTVESGPSVFYRRRDMEALAGRLRKSGHSIDLQFPPDTGPADFFVDYPPYGRGSHLKVLFDGYTLTAFALIVEKKS